MNPTISVMIAICIFCLSCKPNSSEIKQDNTEKVELTGKLRISGAYGLFPIMKIWAEEFNKANPGLIVQVVGSGTEEGIEDLISGKVDMAMVSRNLTETEVNGGLWKVPVSKEGVLPVISEKNPYLDVILEKGVNKETFIKIFSSEKLNWKEITDQAKADRVNVYLRERTSGASEAWSNYVGMQPGQLKGIELKSDSDIIRSVTNDPLSLAFCNAHYAYNMKEVKQQSGIRVLPIDINNNGKIDSKELVYNKLCQVQRAGYLGYFPHELCREMCIVCIKKPEDANSKAFIRWILTNGQEIAVKNGYSELRRCDKEEFLKIL